MIQICHWAYLYQLESGNNIMKKFISIMLTLTMFTSVIYPCQSVIAAEIRQNNALTIGKEISEMCSEYDDTVTKEGVINTRLIVKSDDKIEEYDAIDSVYGFGYAFLQYADEENAEKALHNYENSGYIVS